MIVRDDYKIDLLIRNKNRNGITFFLKYKIFGILKTSGIKILIFVL